MNHFQRRIAELREMIPASAEAGTLPVLHDHLLSLSPHLRLKTKWGNYTEYSVSIRDKDAIELTNGNAPILSNGASRWRIRFGVKFFGDEIRTYAYLESFHPKPVYEWEEYEGEGLGAEAIWEWLNKEQSAVELLLEIDKLLLERIAR